MTAALIVLNVALFAAAIAVVIFDRLDLANEHRKMWAMTPPQAFRHALVLKYLPQSELDMLLLDEAIARGDFGPVPD